MRVLIAPYKLSSMGAKEIANELGAIRIKPERSRYRYRNGDAVINWGRSGVLPFPVALNKPEAVYCAINKRVTWDTLSSRGVPTVSYTRSVEEARQWLESGTPVYIRETLTGYGGAGIHVFTEGNDMADFLSSRLSGVACFTKGFPLRREFRVHVVGTNAVLVSEKKKRAGTNPDPLIRSHGDWVFCRNNLDPYPDTVKQQAIAAVQALGLDFGGVDIGLDRQHNVCVFEVNTAPGITGIAVEVMAAALREAIEAH